MISIMIVGQAGLVGGALAEVLTHETDLHVIATLTGREADPVRSALARRPAVVVIDAVGYGPAATSVAQQFTERLPECRVLLLTNQLAGEALRSALAAGVWGLISDEVTPQELAQSIRQVAAGERVVDPIHAAAALRSSVSVLTDQERAVLRLARDGLRSREIAKRLHLSPGTVRNYLSLAIRKIGARNRLEAIRRAQQEGWL